MPGTKLTITTNAGQELAARLDQPLETPRAYALFAHCFTCGKDLRSIDAITDALTDEGVAVVRFDFTGIGESAGDFADTNFSSNVGDIVEVAEYLRGEFEAPSILIGHSLGGAAVLRAAEHIPSVRAVATIGAPADPSHVTHLLDEEVETIRQEGEATVRLAGRPFTIKRQFLEDLEETRMTESIRNLDRALLLFHAPLDEIVGIENAERIYKVAKHPKSYVSLDGADHLLSNIDDARYVGTVTAAWARKYVQNLDKTKRDVRDNRVIVHTGSSGYRTSIRANGHPLVADEPEEVGGTDEGPSPYEYLAVALGSCTSMTLRMYADRKEWDLDGVTVRLQHEKVHREDCSDPDSKGSKIDRLERRIELDGALDEGQKQRLLEIADRCPVHRTLHSEILVETRLVGDPEEPA